MPSVGSSLPNRGDPGGARKWLGDRGIVVGLEYTADVLSNVSGGMSTGTIYQGTIAATNLPSGDATKDAIVIGARSLIRY